VSGIASKDEENLEKLLDVFEHQWTEYLKKSAEAAKTHFSAAGTLGPLQQLKQEKDILDRRVIDCTSQLRRSQGFAKDLITLIQSLCATDHKWSERLSRLEQADAALRRVKEATESLLIVASDQDELDSHLQRSLELIGSHRDELKLFAQLEKALNGADAHAVEDYIKKSRWEDQDPPHEGFAAYLLEYK
jgi:hypothetical protein